MIEVFVGSTIIILYIMFRKKERRFKEKQAQEINDLYKNS